MAKTVVGLFEHARDAAGSPAASWNGMGLGPETTTFVEQHEPELQQPAGRGRHSAAGCAAVLGRRRPGQSA